MTPTPQTAQRKATSPQDLYPSRTGTEPKLLQRHDPVLHGEPAGALDALQRRGYEAKGFLSLQAFFQGDELETFTAEADRLKGRTDLGSNEEVIAEPDSGAIRSIFDIHRSSEIFSKLARHPRLLAIAREILGGDVYIHQSRINFKPGFRGKEFYWHSDFETWHVEDGMPRMRAVSCSIALTPNTPNNGPLMLIPGSHKRYLSCPGETPEGNYKKSLKKQEVGVPDDESLRQMVDEGGIEAPTGPAGSATFFECNTMHGSNSNITPMARTNFFLVFNSVENQLVEPFCGLEPRPGFIANRSDTGPLQASS